MNKSPANPAVSIIIPAYNAARWISETLNSILDQTFREFEVIVVDDGSTDQTPEVLTRYGSRVRYVLRDNEGNPSAPSARNAGIRIACGDYIAFVDADDLWAPEKLELQMQLFSEHSGLAWVYSDALVFNGLTGQPLHKVSQGGKLHEGDILRSLLLGNFIPSPTPVIRRDVFDTVGYFDESPLLRIGEDWNLWLQIAAVHQVRFVDQPLAKVRRHQTNMTGTMDLQYAFRSKLTIIENAVAREPERLSNIRERAISNMCVGIGQWMMKRSDHVGARKMFARAIRLFPTDVRIFSYLIVTFLPVSVISQLAIVRRFFIRRRSFYGG